MVMPLWDHSPLRWKRPPYMTWTLIALNIAVFGYEIALPDPELTKLVADYGANAPAIVTNDFALSTLVSLVTSQFLHGGLFHLLGNMVFLWVFGDDVEQTMGPWRFLLFYLACGALAVLAFVAASPNSPENLIGASGAIAGVLAGYLMHRPCQTVLVFLPWFILWVIFRPVIRLASYWVIGSWIAVQVWHIATRTQDEVAYMAHLGGLIAGAILFPLMKDRGVKLFECIREEAA